jgi:hypothetical protein
MTKQIKSLTAEQTAKMPEYTKKWIDIGLSTEPVDFEKAKAAICQAYKATGLTEPTNFHVVESPIAAIKLIQTLDPKQKPKDIFDNMIYGPHDASWLGFYQFFRDEVGIQDCHKLDGLIELANHCGWLNVYADTVVFQDRPEVIKFDDQKRLHNPDGPAIRYRDGYSVYSWHGVRIPADWIENKSKLTAKIALTWQNIEQRRSACEILGWAKILKDLDSKVIDEDVDPEIGTLLEVEIPDIGREKFLRVLCGTKREFALPVPPEMTTALEANAWTFGFDSKDFLKPEVRT